MQQVLTHLVMLIQQLHLHLLDKHLFGMVLNGSLAQSVDRLLYKMKVLHYQHLHPQLTLLVLVLLHLEQVLQKLSQYLVVEAVVVSHLVILVLVQKQLLLVMVDLHTIIQVGSLHMLLQH